MKEKQEMEEEEEEKWQHIEGDEKKRSSEKI